jgi:hypothetical protein
MRWNWSDNGIMKWKKRMEQGFQSVGRNIRTNIEEGQKGLKKTDNKYKYRINALKGNLDAFKRGFSE